MSDPDAASPPPPSHPSRWRRTRVVLAIAGLVATITGVVLVATSAPSASFGWFAYAPLSSVTFTPDGTFLNSQQLMGLVVGVLGLLLVAFSAGWSLGVRVRPAADD